MLFALTVKVFFASNKTHIQHRICVVTYVCGYETKPILLSLGSSLLSFAYAHSKRNRHLSVQLMCIYLYVLCVNSQPETVTNV